MDEVKATVSFGTLRRGDRLQVDIHDPEVARLVKGGYLKVVWKEAGDARALDSAGDPDGVELVSAGRVDSGGEGEPETEEVDDGQGEHRPEPEDSDSA